MAGRGRQLPAARGGPGDPMVSYLSKAIDMINKTKQLLVEDTESTSLLDTSQSMIQIENGKVIIDMEKRHKLFTGYLTFILKIGRRLP